MSVNLNADHNPAASYDLGAYLWAIGEPSTADSIMQYASYVPHLDVATAQAGYAQVDASCEAFLNALVEDAVEQLDAMFDEVMSCQSLPPH